MSGPVDIVLEALASPVAARLARCRDRIGRQLLLISLAFAFAALGVVCLAATVYLLAAMVAPDWLAALIVGLVLLVLASILVCVARRVPRESNSSRRANASTTDDAAVRAGRMLAQSGMRPSELAILTGVLVAWALAAGSRSKAARPRARRSAP